MPEATTLTSKGQVTVPSEIRAQLGLGAGDKVVFTLLSDGTVVMRPKRRSLLDLAGALTRKGQPKVSIEEMNRGEAIAPIAARTKRGKGQARRVRA